MYRLILILFIAFLIPQMSFAQNINGRFSSSVYAFERYDTVNVSETNVRAYETLYLNINKDQFSLKTNLNLETNIANSLDDDPRLRFYHLYVEGRNLFNFATVKVGRQPLITSVAGGVIDGLSANFKYTDYSLTGYFGANVPAYQKLEIIDDVEDNYIFGGKFTAAPIENFRVGLSYIDKSYKRQPYTAFRYDINGNPLQVLIENESNQYRFGAADASYSLPGLFRVDAKYEFDFNYEETSKIEFSGRYEQIENLGLSLYYNLREPKIRYNSIFAVFNYGATEEIEGGVDYKLPYGLTVLGKFANVSYEGENSQRITAGVNTDFGGVTYRKNLGYAGELDAVSLYAAHSFMQGFLTPSLGLTYTTYKLSKDDEANDLTAFLGGVNIRPWRTLSFDLQGQYMNNSIYKNDVRAFFKINYWFNTNLKLI